MKKIELQAAQETLASDVYLMSDRYLHFFYFNGVIGDHTPEDLINFCIKHNASLLIGQDGPLMTEFIVKSKKAGGQWA